MDPAPQLIRLVADRHRHSFHHIFWHFSCLRTMISELPSGFQQLYCILFGEYVDAGLSHHIMATVIEIDSLTLLLAPHI